MLDAFRVLFRVQTGELKQMCDDFSNFITAFSTLAIAGLTAFLACENRKLRLAGSDPEIAVYLLPNPNGDGSVNFVISNIGRGPAFNVTYNFLYEEDDFRNHSAHIFNDPDRMPITALPQGEKISALFGIGYRLFGDTSGKDIGPLKPFKVRTQYYDIFGRKKDREQKLDIRQFAGLNFIIEKSYERKISESLEKTEKHMAEISKKSSYLPEILETIKISDRRTRKIKGNPRSDGRS